MKKFKENNKGFSLVELIVVIAIMVVLIAVLGSTILGYVDKSKYSKDITALDSVNTAVKTFVAEPDSVYTDGATYKLSTLWSDTHDKNGVLKSILGEVFNTSTGDFNNASKSFANTDADDVFIKIKNGAVSIHVESADDYADYGVGEKESITNGVTPQ